MGTPAPIHHGSGCCRDRRGLCRLGSRRNRDRNPSAGESMARMVATIQDAWCWPATGCSDRVSSIAVAEIHLPVHCERASPGSGARMRCSNRAQEGQKPSRRMDIGLPWLVPVGGRSTLRSEIAVVTQCDRHRTRAPHPTCWTKPLRGGLNAFLNRVQMLFLLAKTAVDSRIIW